MCLCGQPNLAPNSQEVLFLIWTGEPLFNDSRESRRRSGAAVESRVTSCPLCLMRWLGTTSPLDTDNAVTSVIGHVSDGSQARLSSLRVIFSHVPFDSTYRLKVF